MGDDIKLKYEVINKLFKTSTSTKVLIKSFSIFIPNKKKVWRILGVIIVALIPATIISCQDATVKLFSDTSEMVLNLMLAFFGIVFTGYSIFQALLNEKMLLKMIENTVKKSDGEESLLQDTNKSFVSLMMLIIVLIAGSFLLKITIGNLPDDFLIFKNQKYNEYFATFLITIYLAYAFTVLYEIKCFIYNIAQLFNAYSGTRVIEIIEQANKKE